MTRPQQLRREDYTVGWICALPIELAVAQELLDEEHDGIYNYGQDSNLYTLGRVGEHNVVIACLPNDQVGTSPAAAVAARMQASFPSLRFGLLVGIAGGVPSVEADVRLGDVVVSVPRKQNSGVVQYDLGKTWSSHVERTGFLNSPPAVLLKAVAKLRADHMRKAPKFLEYASKLGRLPAFSHSREAPDVLYEPDYDHEGGPTCGLCDRSRIICRVARHGKAVVHYGVIASGNQVIRSARERDRVSSELGGVLCFEMEAAGLMNEFPSLVIRGICDYADSHKNKYWQGYAAGMAAAYAKELLSVIPATHVSKEQVAGDAPKARKEIDDLLNRLPEAPGVAFNCFQRQHEPCCLTHTRVDILEEIRQWAGSQDEQSIFWLGGMAGTGKSTIARTVAREYYEQGRLGASFFFTQGGGEAGHARRFFTTITRQLAKSVPRLEYRISEAIADRTNIANLSLHDQWSQLIVTPISRLGACIPPLPYILVIDALDECDGDDDIRAILQLITEPRALLPAWIRVLITSRPDTTITGHMCQVPRTRLHECILHNVPAPTVDQDITTYFRHNLTLTGRELSLSINWPGEEIISRLVHKAGGLFIWAATACRYVHQGKSFATSRLATILHGDAVGLAAPEQHLNELYTTVLSDSICPHYTCEEADELCAMLRHVLGPIVVLSSPLALNPLARLLHVTERRTSQVLGELRTILEVPVDGNSPLRLHHPSFRDFLLSKSRCTDGRFWVDKRQAHRNLSDRCIDILSANLKEDILGLGSPGAEVAAIEDSQVELYMPPETRYACLYWVQHLQSSGDYIRDNDKVHHFLRKHILHWLEALSWMRKVSEGIVAVVQLESLCVPGDCPAAYAFVHDVKRFVLDCRLGVEQTPLQLYWSALLFAPTKSLLRSQFEERIPGWSSGIREDWGPLLQTLDGQTLDGHLAAVCGVVFSHDGKQLASAADGGMLRLWDPSTGALLHTLEYDMGGTGFLQGQCFTGDDRTIKAAFVNDSGAWIQSWDALTGLHQQTVKGHPDIAERVSFSPDDTTAAYAFDHCNVQLWDTTTLRVLHTFHDQLDYCLAFSPDGKFIATVSTDKVIHLWDVMTGASLQTFCTNFPEAWDVCTSLAFFPDGTVIAAAALNMVLLLDVPSGHVRQTFQEDIDQQLNVTVSFDGRFMASTLRNNTIIIWDVLSGTIQRTLAGHTDSITALSFSPDDSLLVTASNDMTVRLWDMSASSAINTLSRAKVTVASFSPDGALVAVAADDGSIRLWNQASEAYHLLLEGHNGSVQRLSFSPDGNILASGSLDGTVRLWSPTSGLTHRKLELNAERISWLVFLTFSPNSKMIATASQGRPDVFRVWDAVTGADSPTPHYDGTVYSVAFATNSKLVAVACAKSIWISCVSSGTVLYAVESGLYVYAMAISPDNTMLATVNYNSDIQLRNLVTGEARQGLHSHGASSIVFSTSGVYANTLHGLYFFQPNSAGELAEMPPPLQTPFRRGHWITLHGEKVLWLHPSYRELLASAGNVFVFRDVSGHAVFVKLNISGPGSAALCSKDSLRILNRCIVQPSKAKSDPSPRLG